MKISHYILVVGFLSLLSLYEASSFEQKIFAGNLKDSSIQESEMSNVSSKSNYAGWLISWAGGTATLGRDGVMFSTFYAHSLSKIMHIETGLHYLAYSALYPPLRFGINSMMMPNRSEFDSLRIYSIAWMHDVTIFFQPFGNNFSIGIGPALEWRRQMEATFNIFGSVPSESHLRETVALGGNFKVEYFIPIKQNLDIGIRGQLHLFLAPATTGGFNFPTTGAGSLGFFFRGRW
jgi:hypothetical protein